MAQEFFINSQLLQDKVSSLLPSQGGAGAGLDLSASTQIVPIIDLTESAEGSNVRADLQSAFSKTNCTEFDVEGASSTIITTTGYWRVFGVSTMLSDTASIRYNRIQLNDGVVFKKVFQHSMPIKPTPSVISSESFDFMVFIPSGDSMLVQSTATGAIISGSVRQIADIDGNLINP